MLYRLFFIESSISYSPLFYAKQIKISKFTIILNQLIIYSNMYTFIISCSIFVRIRTNLVRICNNHKCRP